MARNQIKLKSLFIETLERVPLVEHACAKLGVARATYYRWCNNDSEFFASCKNAQDKGREVYCDLAESKIMARINNDDRWAEEYYLSHNSSRYSRYKVIKEAIPEINEGEVLEALDEFKKYAINGAIDRLREEMEAKYKQTNNINSSEDHHSES